MTIKTTVTLSTQSNKTTNLRGKILNFSNISIFHPPPTSYKLNYSGKLKNKDP